MLAMCKPVLPLVWDEMAHLFWKAEHIATVHHHHGDHHAEEESAEAAHEEENDRYPSTTKTSEPVSAHIVVQNNFNIPQPSIVEQQFGVDICKLSKLSLAKHYPPPRSC